MGLEAVFEARNWTAVPVHFWSVVFFVFGSIVGSFLNVCIHRMPRGESVVRPPSHCPHCQYTIPWYLNLPLVTWVYLRGRCAHCRAPIAGRYFLVELLTGVAFLSCWLTFHEPDELLRSAWLSLVYGTVLSGFIVATFIDLEHYIIPDEITCGGMVLGFLCSGLLPELHDARSAAAGLWQSALGMAVGGGVLYGVVRLGKVLFGRKQVALAPGSQVFFLEECLRLPEEEIPYGDLLYRASDRIQLQAAQAELADRCYAKVPVELTRQELRIGDDRFAPETVSYLRVVTDRIVLPREAMGLGDVKFLAAIGAFLGWPGVVFALVASSFVGAAVGVILVTLLRMDRSKHIPYGPYLALGATVWIFYGRSILHWWLTW
jgi:leader peptidase (prepilin peptidase)/N-methyltransferase